MTIQRFYMLTYNLPFPTIRLKWGQDISANDLYNLKNNHATAVLFNEKNEPYKIIFIDYFGTIREKNWLDHLIQQPEHETFVK
jgi:hypothetical protein